MVVAEERRGMGIKKENRKKSCLDTRWGLIKPSGVTWGRVYDVERPETPNDPRKHH